MININWADFFVHHVIFGFWTLRHSHLTVTDKKMHGKYRHEVTWEWLHWQNRFPARHIPWHRCWCWKIRND